MAGKKGNNNEKHHEEFEDMDMLTDFDEGVNVVEITDEEGNSYLYAEEMIIPIGEEKFALLVGIPNEDEDEHHHDHGCDCGCGCNEEDVIIAKIIVNEDGEEEYIDPTDEEFEMVKQAYNEIYDEALDDEE